MDYTKKMWSACLLEILCGEPGPLIKKAPRQEWPPQLYLPHCIKKANKQVEAGKDQIVHKLC